MQSLEDLLRSKAFAGERFSCGSSHFLALPASFPQFAAAFSDQVGFSTWQRHLWIMRRLRRGGASHARL